MTCGGYTAARRACSSFTPVRLVRVFRGRPARERASGAARAVLIGDLRECQIHLGAGALAFPPAGDTLGARLRLEQFWAMVLVGGLVIAPFQFPAIRRVRTDQPKPCAVVGRRLPHRRATAVLVF